MYPIEAGVAPPPAAPPKPRKRRRFLRFIILAIPLSVLTVAVLLLSVVPSLVRSGRLDGFLQRKISEAAGAHITYQTADIPSSRVLMLRGVEIRGFHKAVGPIYIERLRVEFTAPVPFGQIRRVVIDNPVVRLDVDAAKITELKAPEKEPSKKFELRGPIHLPRIEVIGGRVHGIQSGNPYTVSGLGGEIDCSPDGMDVSFSIQGTIEKAADPIVDIRGHLILTHDSGKLAIDHFKFGTLVAALGFDTANGGRSFVDIENFQMTEAVTRVVEEFTGFKTRGLLTSHVKLSLKEGAIQTIEIEGGLKNYAVEGHDVEIEQRDTLLRLKLDRREGGATGPGWRVTGEIKGLQIKLASTSKLVFDQLQVEADIPDDRKRIVGKAKFTKATAVRGDIEGSDIDGEVTLDIRQPVEGSAYAGEAKLLLAKAGFLQGERYIELADNRLELTLKGSFDFARGEYLFQGTDVRFAEFGEVLLSGRVTQTPAGIGYDLDVKATDLDVKTLCKRLTETYDVKDIRGEGKLGAHLCFRDDNGAFQAEGSLSAEHVSFSWSDLDIKDLTGEIPLLIRQGAGKNTDQKRGTLAWKDLKYQIFSLGPQTLPLIAETNLLRIANPIQFSSHEGACRIDGLAIRNPGTGPMEITFGLFAENMNVDKLFSAWFELKAPPQGRLNISFPRVRYFRSTLSFDGQADIQAFGGRMTIRDFRITDLGDSSAMCYRFGFDMKNVLLDQVCQSTAHYGLIKGAAQAKGWIELFNTGLPKAFEVQFETVRKSGVDQVLDMDAVHTMAVVAEGPEVAEKIDTLRTLAEELQYGQFAFYARLYPNWSLYIRGKYHRPKSGGATFEEHTWDELRAVKILPDREEFIMVGRTNKQINIINHPSGQGIDYQLVMERFKQAREDKKEADKKSALKSDKK